MLEEELRKTSRRLKGVMESLRERAELARGSFTIDAVEGRGTVIRATWPIP